MKNLFFSLFAFFCIIAMNAQGVIDLDKDSKFKPKASSWKDSYSANGFCWCDSNFDHGIDKKTAQINGKNFSVKDICNELKSHPNYRKWKNGDPRYNDIQCGNGPQNTAPDEPACPGRVDLKYCDRGHGDERWDMAWLATRKKFNGNGTTPSPSPSTNPDQDANESVTLAQEYTGNGGSGNNQGPRARLLAPSTGVFTAPANFKIELEATDSDGIDRVEIEVINGTSKQTDKTAPYEMNVTDLAEGRYFVQIIAYDKKGNETDVDFFIQVNKGTGSTNDAPTISFSKPLNNATFKAPASFDVTVNASDSDGSVNNVRLSIDNKFIRQENVAPYTWTTALDTALTNLSVGTYTLKAEATDNQGKTSKKSISITVGSPTPPPVVKVDGGTISGGPFTFTVGDGIVDNVSTVALTGNVGTNSRYIITDEALNILGLPPTPEAVNFDIAGAGVCLIWHISYENGLTGLEAGQNTANLSGTFDLSNSVTVNRVAFATLVNGGTITTSLGATTVTTITGDSIDDIVVFENSSTSSEAYIYLITDESGNILTTETASHNFEGVAPGICKVYGLSYTGTLSVAGKNVADAGLSSGEFMMSSNSITVTRNAVVTAAPTNNGSAIATITKPKNNQVFKVGETVAIDVTTNNNNDVAKIELYLNGEFVRQEKFAPYNWGHLSTLDPELKNLKAGIYAIKAIVTDKKGGTNETSISVTVGNASPAETGSLSFAKPNTNQTFNVGETVLVDVRSNVSVKNVRLYLNDKFIRQENVSPYLWGKNDDALKNLKAGTYTLKAIAANSDGSTSETQISVTIGSRGAKLIENNPFITLYPNPATVSVTVDGATIGTIISIYNGLGKVVKQVIASSTVQEITLDGLPAGLYFVNSNNEAILKLIIK